MLSRPSIPLAENVHKPIHIVSSDASASKQSSTFSFTVRKYLLSMLVSATIGNCSLDFKKCATSPGSTALSKCFVHIFAQIFFSSSLKWTLNGAYNAMGSNTENTRNKICLWVMGASTSLLVPLQTWRLSSVTFHWSPSTNDTSVFGWKSACLVLQVDCKSCRILGSISRCCLTVSSTQIRVSREELVAVEQFGSFFKCFYWFDTVIHVEVNVDCFCRYRELTNYWCRLVWGRIRMLVNFSHQKSGVGISAPVH